MVTHSDYPDHPAMSDMPLMNMASATSADTMPRREHDMHTGASNKPTMDAHAMMGHAGMSAASMSIDMRNRFFVSLLFTIPIFVTSHLADLFHLMIPPPFGLSIPVFGFLMATAVVLYGAWPFFTGAWSGLRQRTLNMSVLVSISVLTAYIFSVGATFIFNADTFYEAAAMLTTFVLFGHWMEMRSRSGTNQAIEKLVNLTPPKAHVERDGAEIEIPTDQVQVGDLLVIRPGDRIPVDAEVVEGQSNVNESMITGESQPVSKVKGAALIGATINGNGSLKAKATRIGADTTLSQIVKLVQSAQESKAPAQRLADQAAQYLVLIAVGGGLLTFAYWFLIRHDSIVAALTFAIAVVVITCPDALGLATPTAVAVGTGLGAQNGILYKNAEALEGPARINTIVFDKTGTLTRGQPEVIEVIAASGMNKSDLLQIAAAAEADSEHPLAQAVMTAAQAQHLKLPHATDFQAVPGHGLQATIDDRAVLIGNRQLMVDQQIAVESLTAQADKFSGAGRTVIYIAIDKKLAGLIAIADQIRPGAKEAIAQLQKLGIEVAMLTGDNKATAEQIASELGIKTVFAEVLPGQKADKVKSLQAQGKRVAMVGDGINDSPALAQADMGIAIGAGSDVAVEAADIVLMKSEPFDVVNVIELSRATLNKMRQNLAWAVGYNVIAIPIAAGIFADRGFILRPEISALAMSGSSIIVAVNAVLLRRARLTHLPKSA